MKAYALILFALTIISCQTVTISNKHFKLASMPHYEETKWFFLWGLIPSLTEVNLEHACSKQAYSQLQTLDTFFDNVIKIATLGIVMPRTARVWCKNK